MIEFIEISADEAAQKRNDHKVAMLKYFQECMPLIEFKFFESKINEMIEHDCSVAEIQDEITKGAPTLLQ